MSGSARKRLLWCFAAAIAVTGGIALFVWLSPKLHVSEETFLTIRAHMTEAEIESLLGGRGSKGVVPMAKGEWAVRAWTDNSFKGSHETLRVKEWRTPKQCIKVGFNEDGAAVYALLTTSTADMSFWQKVRWWTGM